MASSFKPQVVTKFARGTIPPYSFVQLDSTSPSSTTNPGVVSCTSGRPYGISQNSVAVLSGSEVEIAIPGAGGLLAIGGTVSLQNALKPTTGGKGIATTSAGDYVGARAESAGISGDIIGVLVVSEQKQSADAV